MVHFIVSKAKLIQNDSLSSIVIPKLRINLWSKIQVFNLILLHYRVTVTIKTIKRKRLL